MQPCLDLGLQDDDLAANVVRVLDTVAVAEPSG